MRSCFPLLLPLLFLSALFSHTYAQPTSVSLPVLPFNLTYVFTANLNFGPPATPPIPLFGECGITIPVPVINGTVTGPGISGVILGGTAGGDYYKNGILERPHIVAYGRLDSANEDEGYFKVQEDGVAMETTHMTRIYLDLSGSSFAHLKNGYILARTRQEKTDTGLRLEAECWLVTDAAP